MPTTYIRQTQQPAPTLLTYHDAIERLVDFSGSGLQGSNLREYKAAVEEAYREVVYARDWKYFFSMLTLNLAAPYETGTVEYDHTGGTYERMLTLTSGTWPDAIIYYHILIDGTFYDVEERKSSTVITLSVNNNPGADIASGTTYTAYRASYTLPGDFRSAYNPTGQTDYWIGCYVRPNDWHQAQRYLNQLSTPRVWTLMADQRLIGSMAVYIWPYPSSAESYQLIYQRAPRELLISGLDATYDYAGSVAATSGGTTVTGTSTAFRAAHVGSVIRFGDATNVPDGTRGLYPYLEQQVIAAVGSTSSATLASAAGASYSGAKYRISDPVDLPPYMLNAFLSCCRYRYSLMKPAANRNVAQLRNDYMYELTAAMEADSMVIDRKPASLEYDRMENHPGAGT